MLSGTDIKHKYCARVEYHKGEEVSQAMCRKPRPRDSQGLDVWDRTADAIKALDVNTDDYLDWCFKEAIPGLPFLNTLPGGVSKFAAAGRPAVMRKDTALHVQLMVERFKKLLEPRAGVDLVLPQDILFDARYEFHPVFATELAIKLNIDIPEAVYEASEKISKTLPYYRDEMETLLKNWKNPVDSFK